MELVKLFGPSAIFFIMFTLGLELKFDNFTKVVLEPKSFIVGFISQILLIPFLGITIIFFVPLSIELKIGLLLIIVLPSATMSNYITKLISGNVALSILLTAITSLVGFISIPIILTLSFKILSLNTNINIDLLKVSLFVFLITAVPTMLGLLINKYFIKLSNIVLPTFNIISVLLFLIIIFGAIYTERTDIKGYMQYSGGISLILIISILIFSLLITSLFIKKNKDRKTIVVECVLQNGAMGLVVGGQIFNEIVYVLPVATYALIQYLVIFFYVFFVNKS